jgi:sugar phosphate isomerase/epimerase
MEFGVSTRLFYSDVLGVDTLERIRRAGFGRIELVANRPHYDYHSRKLQLAVARWFDENELPAPSVHLPFEERVEGGHLRSISALASEGIARQKAMDEMKRCLELAERIQLAYVVLHLGVPGQPFSPASFDYAYSAVAQIHAFAGVRVLIENIENSISTIERVREFVELTNLTNIGVCYDTAHGHASNGAATFGAVESCPIVALHLRDRAASMGQGQETAKRPWPFEGKISWPLFVEKLTLAKFNGPQIFETDDGDLGKAHEAQRRLEELRAEAENSIEEFRLKHKLPAPRREEEE